jgi:hypothetical protein
LSLLPLLLLTACATRQAQAVKCEIPELRGDTWADVAVFAVEAKSELEICNARNRH